MFFCISDQPKFINLFLIFLLLFFSSFTHAEKPLKKVSVQLDWKYQFEFAGFIAAKEKGFYKEAGLDVDLIEYQNGIDIGADVLARKSTYGIKKTSLYIKAGKIVPIKLLVTYFPKPPLILITSPDIKSPNDLIGKKVMLAKEHLHQSALGLMLDHFYLTDKNIHPIKHSFDINDFIQHKVDAFSAYRTNEIFVLEQQNIKYNIVDPSLYGYNLPVGNLFTSINEAEENPNRTRKFVDASNKGWVYALSHETELIAIIYDKYSKKKSIEALRFEAEQIKKLMPSSPTDIGTIDHSSQLKLFEQLRRSTLLLKEQEITTIKKLSFTEEQLHYLKNKKEITLCITPNRMPLEDFNHKKHKGIVSTIFNQFKNQLPIPIRIIETKSQSESIAKIRNRECDVLSIAISTRRGKEFMNFTSSYLSVSNVIATKKETFFIANIADIKDQPLGIIKGSAMAELLRNKYKNIKIVIVDSTDDGLRRVETGELFGYIDNLAVITFNIKKGFSETLKVSARLDEAFNLSVATRNDEPLLHDIFEQLVNHLDDTKVQSNYNQWISVTQEISFDIRSLWQYAIALFFIIISFIFYSIRLKQLNAKLTRQSNQLETDVLNRTQDLLEAKDLAEMEKQRFKTIFEKSGYGLSILENGKLTACNEALVKLLGYQSKSALMTSPDKLSPLYQLDGSLSSEKAQKVMKKCLQEGSNQFEWVHQKQNGTHFLVDILLTRIEYKNNVAIHATWRDISHQKKLELDNENIKNEAIFANKAKSEFLANMSHELRTPMHGILSFANFGISKSEVATREKLKKYFSNIQISGDRLLLLLNDLLDLSKLEAGKMALNKQKTNLSQLFETCCAEQEQRINDLGLTLQVNNSKQGSDGLFDSTQIGQVITNILSNAIKFSPKNSVITVTIGSDDKYLNFSLQDQGIGIPEEELKNVFDAFIQSSKTKTGSGGTGLGLAICKKIINAHNGKIWAENNPDDGAIFKFSLPLSLNK